MVGALSRLDRHVGDAERIDRFRLLQELKSAAAAAQAVETAGHTYRSRAPDPPGRSNEPSRDCAQCDELVRLSEVRAA